MTWSCEIDFRGCRTREMGARDPGSIGRNFTAPDLATVLGYTPDPSTNASTEQPWLDFGIFAVAAAGSSAREVSFGQGVSGTGIGSIGAGLTANTYATINSQSGEGLYFAFDNPGRYLGITLVDFGTQLGDPERVLFYFKIGGSWVQIPKTACRTGDVLANFNKLNPGGGLHGGVRRVPGHGHRRHVLAVPHRSDQELSGGLCRLCRPRGHSGKQLPVGRSRTSSSNAPGPQGIPGSVRHRPREDSGDASIARSSSMLLPSRQQGAALVAIATLLALALVAALTTAIARSATGPRRRRHQRPGPRHRARSAHRPRHEPPRGRDRRPGLPPLPRPRRRRLGRVHLRFDDGRNGPMAAPRAAAVEDTGAAGPSRRVRRAPLVRGVEQAQGPAQLHREPRVPRHEPRGGAGHDHRPRRRRHRDPRRHIRQPLRVGPGWRRRRDPRARPAARTLVRRRFGARHAGPHLRWRHLQRGRPLPHAAAHAHAEVQSRATISTARPGPAFSDEDNARFVDRNDATGRAREPRRLHPRPGRRPRRGALGKRPAGGHFLRRPHAARDAARGRGGGRLPARVRGAPGEQRSPALGRAPVPQPRCRPGHCAARKPRACSSVACRTRRSSRRPGTAAAPCRRAGRRDAASPTRMARRQASRATRGGAPGSATSSIRWHPRTDPRAAPRRPAMPSPVSSFRARPTSPPRGAIASRCWWQVPLFFSNPGVNRAARWRTRTRASGSRA